MERLRVLHVVAGLDRGGIETWLMHLLRHADPGRVRFDFLLDAEGTGAYEREALERGCRVHRLAHRRSRLAYARELRSLVRGAYDVVHAHVDHYSGWVLRAAALEGVPVRIVSSHNDFSGTPQASGLIRKLYLAWSKRLIRRHATAGLAPSRGAARWLFGRRWERDPRWKIHPYSIDLGPFREPADRHVVREALGIPPDAFVIGHAGKFQEQKNHRFLLRVAREAAAREPRVRLVLAGRGHLQPEIESLAREMGVAATFLGSRSDVPRLMKGAFDVFVFPSLHEGCPLAVLEAQAAGLRCVVSDRIPEEAVVVPELVRRISLESPLSEWVESALGSDRRMEEGEALAAVERGPINVENAISQLMALYTPG